MSTENNITTQLDQTDYGDFQEVPRPQEPVEDKPNAPETVSYAEYSQIKKSNDELRKRYNSDLDGLKHSTRGLEDRFSGLENTLGEMKSFLESVSLGQTQNTQTEETSTPEIDDYSSDDDFVTRKDLGGYQSRIKELEQELKLQKESAFDPNQFREDVKKELTAEWEKEQAEQKIISDQNTLVKAGEDPANVEMAGYWLVAETNRLNKAIENNPYDEELKQRLADLSSSFLESYQIFKNEKQGLFADANANQKANEVIANQANSAYRNNVMPNVPGQAGSPSSGEALSSLRKSFNEAMTSGEDANARLSQF